MAIERRKLMKAAALGGGRCRRGGSVEFSEAWPWRKERRGN